MNPKLKIVQGNLPLVSSALVDDTGAPVDLTGCTVQFIFQLTPAGINFTEAAAIDGDATLGKVNYQMVAPQTATPGCYRGQWRVTRPDASQSLFPVTDYFTFEIVEALPLAVPADFTLLSQFYDDIRAVTGDFKRRLFQDADIASVMRVHLRAGRIRNENCRTPTVWKLTPDIRGISPAITDADMLAYSLLVYRTAETLVMPTMESYSFRTRAFSERFGERKDFIFDLSNVIHELENGQGVWANVHSLRNWLFAINGIWIWSLTQAEQKVELSFH